MNAEKTGKFISELRKEKDMTQQQLAERLYVSDKAVSRWETGRGFPEIGILEELAAVLEVNVAELLKGERIKGDVSKDDMRSITDDSLKISKEYINRKRRTYFISGLLLSLMILITVLIHLNAPIYFTDPQQAVRVKKNEDMLIGILSEDVTDCDVEFVKDEYELDLSRVGMIGYSMGGRLTCLYIREHPEISCIGLWTAASYDGFNGSDEFLGVPLDQMKKEAKEKGYCDFHNGFDDTWIKLNSDLICQMEELSPVKGLNEFEGNAILVHGDEDITVPYDVSLKAYEELKCAKDRKLVTVKGADHGFGAWNDRPDLSKQLTDATVAFFKEHMDL